MSEPTTSGFGLRSATLGTVLAAVVLAGFASVLFHGSSVRSGEASLAPLPGSAAAVDASFESAGPLLVHLGSAVPLAGLIALALASRSSTTREVLLTFGGTMGAALVLLYLASAGWIDEGKVGRETFPLLVAFHAALATVCLVAVAYPLVFVGLRRRREATERESSRGPAGGLVDLGLAVAVASVLPACFLLAKFDRETKTMGELLRQGRYLRASQRLERIRAFGFDAPILGEEPRKLSLGLRRRIAQARQLVHRFEAKSANGTLEPGDRIGLARELASLDHFAEAADLLLPIASDEVQASLLLAAIRQRQELYGASTRWYEHAQTLLPDGPEQVGAWVRTYDGLAYNAREMGRYRDAEQAYARGLARLPQAAAHFHYQLGRHHEQGGRPAAALQHYERAVELDPANFTSLVAPRVRELRVYTPGCLVGMGEPATSSPR